MNGEKKTRSSKDPLILRGDNETFYPARRVSISRVPPKERWDDWTELDFAGLAQTKGTSLLARSIPAQL